MTVYNFVRNVLTTAGIQDLHVVQKFVGTARTMGFEGDLSDGDQRLLKKLVLDRVASTGKQVTASAGAEKFTSHARFEEIDSLRGRNLCPRCKTEMNPAVKLADYQIAKYCKACKVALWPDE